MKKKIIRTATVPLSLDLFCRGFLRELSKEYEVVVVSSPLPELDSIRHRERVRTIGVPMERKIAPLKDLVSLFRLVRVFRKEKPDMVHSITPKAGLLSMIAAWLARVPVRVHTFTGLLFPYATGWRRVLLRMTDSLTAGCATHVIPEGEGIRDDLVRSGITKKPLKVLGFGNLRGIDMDYYARTEEILQRASRLRAHLGISGDAFVFLFVGRFDYDKGIVELVRATCMLEREGFDIHLLMVGEEEPDGKPLPMPIVQVMATSPRIHLSDGWQEDVRPWYAAADVLVHPSYREGFPNVVVEAGAMDLSSIVTDINGSREIIREGENGFIVSSGDEEALYEAMKRFIMEPELSHEMAAKAREMIGDRFEQTYVRNCLKEFYHEILQ